MGFYSVIAKKWAWGLIPLAAPLAGALVLTRPELEKNVASSAKAALQAASPQAGDFNSIKIKIEGRDVVLSGEVPDKALVELAAKTVARSYGVRRVDTSAVSIAKPVVLEKPVVKPVAGNNPKPVITGTWPAGKATTLAVTVAGKTYTLGKDDALTSDDAGNWKLMPGEPLEDGVYDIKVKITDGRRATAGDATENELVIDTKPPASPAVTSPGLVNRLRPELSGTFDAGDTKNLSVEVAGNSYRAENGLRLDSKGRWQVTPLSDLKEGENAITVIAADKYGNEARVTGKVIVDVTAPEKATMKPYRGSSNMPELTGNWSGGEGDSLKIKLAGKTYQAGKDGALKTSGKSWTLVPDALEEGTYDADLETSDRAGNTSHVKQHAAIIIDSTPPLPGTVNLWQGADERPQITGKWQADEGNSLSVRVGGKTYVAGRDKQLQARADGTWTLVPDEALGNGRHDVTVSTSDALGNKASMTAPGAIVIDTVAPKAPAVVSARNLTSKPEISGTWDEADATRLQVLVDGKVFALGRDRQLTTDGKGRWNLRLENPLGDGKHAILVETADRFGNISRSGDPFVATVDGKAPAAAKIGQVVSNSSRPKLTGQWDETKGNRLSITVRGKTYVAGDSPELKSDGKGNWTFMPSSPLEDNVYGVTATVTGKAGNKTETSRADAIIVDTTAPPAPTVATVLTRNRRPLVSGSFSSSKTDKLTVSLAGKTYGAGNLPGLKTQGDNWSVVPQFDLADGRYDVVVTASDKAGNSSTDKSKNEILVDGTSPPAPTVRPSFGLSHRPVIRGTWPEGSDHTLSVTLDGKSHVVTSDGPLTSDGKGNWTLRPDHDLATGSHDVEVLVSDKMGNQSRDLTKNEVLIKNPPPSPEPEKAEQKTEPEKAEQKTEPEKVEQKTEPAVSRAACLIDLNNVMKGEKIMFATNKAVISPESGKLLDALAAAAKSCPDKVIEIGGHTDSRGSDAFNKSLSEARAGAVLDALVARGVKRGRLKAVGYGETMPVADNKSAEGRAANRRIEFKIVK